jgi:hypothetical protein
MVQELTVRLGIFTGRGYSELVRHHFGRAWGWVSTEGLAVAVAGSMITEFAAGGRHRRALWNFAQPDPSPCSVDSAGHRLVRSYRRVERAAILIGSFELAFLLVGRKDASRLCDGSA